MRIAGVVTLFYGDLLVTKEHIDWWSLGHRPVTWRPAWPVRMDR